MGKVSLKISDPDPIIQYKMNKHVSYLIQLNISSIYYTRRPRGPWVAHLMKRSKVTVEPIIENPRGHNLNNFGRGPFDDVIY